MMKLEGGCDERKQNREIKRAKMGWIRQKKESGGEKR